MECQDTFREILYRLPLPDLNNFKAVNKESNSLISNPDFEQDKHRVMGDNAVLSIYNREEQLFKVSSIRSRSEEPAFISSLKLPWFEVDDNPPPMIIGSFNGLIGVKFNYFDYMLCNPVIDEYLSYTGYGALVTDPIAVGICHNSYNDEYMAVVIGTFKHNGENLSCVELINFSTNESKSVNVTLGLKGVGTVVCGLPHWVKESERKEVVFFEPIKEMFDEIELPKGREEKVVLGLGSVEKQRMLSVVFQGIKNPNCVEIWVMKKYSDIESWTYLSKTSSLNIKNEWEYVNVIGLKSREIWIDHKISPRESEIPKVITYDPENEKTYNNNGGLAKEGAVVNITSYEPSLVSPLWSRIKKLIHMLSLEFDKIVREE